MDSKLVVHSNYPVLRLQKQVYPCLECWFLNHETQHHSILNHLRLSVKYVADHHQLWAPTTKTTKTGEQGSGNDWTAFCNQLRRSLLFEAKCQWMSIARCLWGLEKDYRLKFKSVTCLHYPVGCKSCKHLLCRLVYYSVSCTHYSVSCKHSLCRQVERHLSFVNIYFVGCTNYSASYVHYLLGQL